MNQSTLRIIPREIIVNQISRFLWSKERLCLYQVLDSPECPLKKERRIIYWDLFRFKMFYRELIELGHEIHDINDDRLVTQFYMLEAWKVWRRDPRRVDSTLTHETWNALRVDKNTLKTIGHNDVLRQSYEKIDRANKNYFREPLERIWVDETFMTQGRAIQRKYRMDEDYHLLTAINDLLKLEIPTIMDLHTNIWKPIVDYYYRYRDVDPYTNIFHSLFFNYDDTYYYENELEK